MRELAAIDRRLAAHARFIETCCTRPWPGNVRELLGAVRLAAAAAREADREIVRPEDLPPDAGQPLDGDGTRGASPSPLLDRVTVVEALAAAGGVVSVAARALGLHRTQLYRLMEKLGIDRDAP